MFTINHNSVHMVVDFVLIDITVFQNLGNSAHSIKYVKSFVGGNLQVRFNKMLLRNVVMLTAQ